MHRKLALDAVEDLDNYLKSGGVCAVRLPFLVHGRGRHTDGAACQVFDATNSTRERRSMVIDEIKKRGLSCLIVESVCDDDDRIDQNIMVHASLSVSFSPLTPAASQGRPAGLPGDDCQGSRLRLQGPILHILCITTSTTCCC